MFTFVPEMDEKELQILLQVEALFMQYGVKSLTMDDVARHLSISKKTLYQYVSNKNELVQKALGRHIDKERQDMEEICSSATNAIDELFAISKHVSGMLKNIHPSVVFDLQKYYPEAWQIFDEYKMNYIYDCISTNLERGIKEGLYRDNLDVPIVSRIYIGRVDMLFDPKLFPPGQFNIADVYLELIRYHVRGIASEKGIEYLVKKVQDIDPNDSKNFVI